VNSASTPRLRFMWAETGTDAVTMSGSSAATDAVLVTFTWDYGAFPTTLSTDAGTWPLHMRKTSDGWQICSADIPPLCGRYLNCSPSTAPPSVAPTPTDPGVLTHSSWPSPGEPNPLITGLVPMRARGSIPRIPRLPVKQPADARSFDDRPALKVSRSGPIVQLRRWAKTAFPKRGPPAS
jgi:hypothetical protein